MANNPYVNKVVFGSATLVDLTGTTATADKIMQGYGAFGADGAWMDGTASGGDQHGTIWQDGQGYVHLDDESGIALQSKSVTPSESQQIVEAGEGYYALDKVTVGAISSSYVGSGVTRRSSSDLSASGATVTAPAGYYASSASKSVASGTAGTPTATKSAVSNHAVTVTPSVTNTTGYITGSTKTGTAVSVSASELVSGTYNVTSSGTKDVTNYASASVPAGTAGTPTATKGTVSNHAVTVTPSVTNTAGYISGGTKTGTGVSVSASELVSGTYSVTSSGTKDVTNYASASVPAGTEGTPTATKGTVSNHSVSVTPSVTNTAGYISGGTKTGAAVTVSASELVSGTKNITENGTGIDVTNYASVDVNVSGPSSSSYELIASTTYVVNTSSTTAVSVGTFNTGNTSIWTSDKMLYVKIRDTAGRRNGYYYGSDCMFANSVPGNNLSATSNYSVHGTSYYQNSAGNLVNFTLQRTSSSAATQGYGVYATHVHDDGSIDIYARYNSSNTLTINGTFKVDVYLLDWPGGVSPFNG